LRLHYNFKLNVLIRLLRQLRAIKILQNKSSAYFRSNRSCLSVI